MKTSARMCALVAVATLAAIGGLSGTGPMMLGATEAHAIVGRPLTPMSYAGVARRTTRRAYRAGAYGAYAAPYGYPAGVAVVPPTATVVTALPAGCTQVPAGATVVYQCGAARYQPYYEGPTVVYQVVR